MRKISILLSFILILIFAETLFATGGANIVILSAIPNSSPQQASVDIYNLPFLYQPYLSWKYKGSFPVPYTLDLVGVAVGDVNGDDLFDEIVVLSASTRS
jgi:hypothetical protein